MINKPSVTTYQNSTVDKESIITYKMLTPSKINSKSIYCFQEICQKFTSASPQEKHKLLRKKRKMSDFIPGFSNAIEKESPFKTNRLVQSPHITETKITSYFYHKKISSYQSKPVNINLQTKYNNENESLEGSSNKFTFAKRLLFEDLDKNTSIYYDNLNSSHNLQFSMMVDKNKQTIKNATHDDTKNVLPNNKYTICEKENYYDLNRHPIPKISDKTQDLLSKINNCKEKGDIQNQNLNLNFQKIIKNNNKIKIEKNTSNKQKSIKYIENIEKYLTTYSIKDKYEELITRDLMLPCKYKSLLKKFEKLDEILNRNKNLNEDFHLNPKDGFVTRKEINLLQLGKQIKAEYDLDITKEDFQKILFITPHFFIYKWDLSYGEKLENDNLNYELFIDIPCDILKRMDERYTENTNFTNLQTFPYIPLAVALNVEVLKKRFSTFKKILLHLINEQHKVFLKEKGIITRLNPFKHRTWHSEFNVNDVRDIDSYKLIDQPKTLRKFPQ